MSTDTPISEAVRLASSAITYEHSYNAMFKHAARLERELTAETEKVKKYQEIAIDRGNQLIVANADLIAEREKVKRLREALEKILPKVAHEYQCGTVRPAMHWAEHGSMSFDNCQCEIKSVSATLEATKS